MRNAPWNEKPRSLNVRLYAARLIYLNQYLASFTGVTLNDKIGITELNKILLNSMPNSWSNQAYAQDFDCEYIHFRKDDNMFKHIEISEYIYKDVVEFSYKKPTGAGANRAGHSRQNRGEAALSRTRPEKGKISGKRRKRYVDSPTGKSKTYLIHGPRNYSE